MCSPSQNRVKSDKNILSLFQQSVPKNQHQTLIIEEFEPDVFRQLIEYIHTGCVTLQPRTLLGKIFRQQYLWSELDTSCLEKTAPTGELEFFS